jgi:hypothetical protein
LYCLQNVWTYTSIDALSYPGHPESSANGSDKLGTKIFFVLGGLQLDRLAVVKAFIGIIRTGLYLVLEFC